MSKLFLFFILLIDLSILILFCFFVGGVDFGGDGDGEVVFCGLVGDISEVFFWVVEICGEGCFCGDKGFDGSVDEELRFEVRIVCEEEELRFEVGIVCGEEGIRFEGGIDCGDDEKKFEVGGFKFCFVGFCFFCCWLFWGKFGWFVRLLMGLWVVVWFLFWLERCGFIMVVIWVYYCEN